MTKNDIPGVFREKDVFTPTMREAVEKFYSDVEIDLFESERKEHMELCRRLADEAERRGREKDAAKIRRRFWAWDRKHTRAFLAEIVHGEPVNCAKREVRHG